MTACADKVAYLSEYLASNAATLHFFVHPACRHVEAYHCKTCDGWHIGHLTPDAGDRCKAEPPVKPIRPSIRTKSRTRGARTP